MEYINEGEATAAAGLASDFDGATQQAGETFDGAGTTELTTNDTGETGGVGDNFIVTESYVVPPATPKWHSGSITSLSLLETTKGSTALVTTLHSDGNGRDYEMKSWLPAAWVANPRISQAELEALPRPEGVNAKGNPKQTQAQRFGSTISNSRNDADVQKLINIAKRAGRVIPKPTYTTIQEFVDQFNTTLAGTPAVFTTREEKNDDPQFAPREGVSGIFGYDFDTSKLKKYEAASGQ